MNQSDIDKIIANEKAYLDEQDRRSRLPHDINDSSYTIEDLEDDIKRKEEWVLEKYATEKDFTSDPDYKKIKEELINHHLYHELADFIEDPLPVLQFPNYEDGQERNIIKYLKDIFNRSDLDYKYLEELMFGRASTLPH